MYPLAEMTDQILAFLSEQKSTVGEYEVIQALDAQGAFACTDAFSPSLRLFHKHFVTMHCLYRLQQTLYPQRLDVGPLAIRLYPPIKDCAQGSAVNDDLGQLRAYYLNLSHLDEATEDTVAQLLKQFWQRFDAHTQADDAFAALGLTQAATWDEVKHAYRQQIQQAHPDKGGSGEHFARLQDAYSTLKRRFL